MPLPILKQGDCLVVAIADELTDGGWADFRTDLLARAGKFRSKGVVIDLSAMDVLDSYATRILDGIAQMLRLRGVTTVVAGLQPGVAFAMSQLGLRLSHSHTALDLDDGLAQLQRQLEGTPRV